MRLATRGPREADDELAEALRAKAAHIQRSTLLAAAALTAALLLL